MKQRHFTDEEIADRFFDLHSEHTMMREFIARLAAVSFEDDDDEYSAQVEANFVIEARELLPLIKTGALE